MTPTPEVRRFPESVSTLASDAAADLDRIDRDVARGVKARLTHGYQVRPVRYDDGE